MRPKNFGLLLLLLALLALCPAAASAQQKALTIEEIYDPVKRVNFSGSAPSNLVWLNDGEHYLQSGRGGGAALLKVNARTGESAPFFDAARMESALSKVSGVTAEEARRLARQGSYKLNAAQTAVLLNASNDLVYYELGAESATRLTSGAEEELEEDFSPDGSLVSFVRANDLYVVDVRTRAERRLTRTGAEKILNGVLDWVYEEELYGRGARRGYWWSPDSRRIAFLNTDERPVKTFPIVDHIPRGQVLESTPYPLAGDPNPLVRLGVAEAAGAGEPRWVDAAGYTPTDFLVVRVAWSPDSRRVVYQAQNREQTFLDLNAADPSTGKTSRIFRETTKAWVEAVDDNPRWLRDGSFLWKSERDGWQHVYHYSADGRLVRQVTKGPWEVRGIDAVDEAGGWLYFHGTEHSHVAEHVYRVKLDGTGLKRLSQTEGYHRPNFSPTAALYIDSWSDVNTPTQVRLHNADGSQARVIAENRVEALGQYKLGKAEFMKVRTRDGFEMEAMMIRPPDFDPSKKYPVLQFTYSGPHAPQVRNTWGGPAYMWHQLMAQKGYIIWYLDNRTASGKGAVSTWVSYKNFGPLELRDLEDGLAYLKTLPYVDGERVGIWGWSFGGYMTTYALTRSKLWKVGVAGGSVTDWANYDSIYTERYMLTPQNNPEGYRAGSPLAGAANLSGKLLLIHGAIDDNVHVANTIQFAYELQKAGRQFELMLYPKSRHGVTDPLLVRHMRQMMTDFIVANL